MKHQTHPINESWMVRTVRGRGSGWNVTIELRKITLSKCDNSDASSYFRFCTIHVSVDYNEQYLTKRQCRSQYYLTQVF